MGAAFEIAVGDVVTRAQVKSLYGGGMQGGMIAAVESKKMFLYSDPSVGEGHGYIFDGWVPDDDAGPLYHYTGHGTTGDQQLTLSNRALLIHRELDRDVHLFVCEGFVQGSGTKQHYYLGQFELDPLVPYLERYVADGEGTRRLIVFQLRPVGNVYRVSAHDAAPAPASSSHAVPADLSPTGTLVDPEKFANAASLRKTLARTVAAYRREGELVTRYRAHLEESGHVVKRWQCDVEGLPGALLTDLYDVTAHELYEAKGTNSRDAVRLAIGQLLDYQRFVTPSGVRLTVLLPRAPHEDLVSLLHGIGIDCVYTHGSTFTRLTAPTNSASP